MSQEDAPPPQFSLPQEKLEECVAQVVKQAAATTNELTEKELIQALTQAIRSGDFVRHVSVDDKTQQVIYVPFRGKEYYREQVKYLEGLLDAGIPGWREDDDP